MLLDMSIPITNMDGTPLKFNGKDGTTFGELASEAVLGMNPQEKMPADEKVALYNIAKKIMSVYERDVNDKMVCKDPSIVDFTIEEVVTIKKQVGELFFPVIVGQMFEIIDGPKVIELCEECTIEPRAEVD